MPPAPATPAMLPAQQRPSWDDYFMQIAHVVATRSTCVRRHVGAVLVCDKRILATGYNGVPKGIEHCDVRGCLRAQLGIPSGTQHELCRGLHAEQNALVQAARHGGIAADGSTLYCTAHPCVQCTKMLINAGVRRIVFGESYPDELSCALLGEAGVEVVHYEGPAAPAGTVAASPSTTPACPFEAPAGASTGSAAPTSA